MIEQRPDEVKFQMFAAPLIAVDKELELFCKTYNYKLYHNVHRQPCRVLKIGDNPEYMLEIFLADYWYESEFSEHLKYSMICCAYYKPEEDPAHLWKIEAMLLEETSLQMIQLKLQEQLLIALDKIDQWTPAMILKEGQKKDNFAYLYRDHFK